MNRKEAIKTMGKYAGMTALVTFMILNPKQAQAYSCGTRTTPTSPNTINW